MLQQIEFDTLARNNIDLALSLDQYLDGSLSLDDLENSVDSLVPIYSADFDDCLSREMKHDLKSYFNVIQSYVSLTKLGFRDDTIQKRIGVVSDVLERTSISLYDEFFPNFKFSQNPSNNYDLVKDLSLEIENLSNYFDLAIKVDIDIDYPFITKVAGSHIYRVIKNLAENKHRYAKNGNLEMFVKGIELDDFIHYDIYDNSGVGISSKFVDANEIFNLGISEHGSSGIGLNSSKKIVESNLNGYLRVIRKSDDSFYDGAKFELGVSKNNYLKNAVFF